MKYSKPRGTEDCFGSEQIKFRLLTDILSFVAKLNGYSEIRTPIFETSELFIRSVGEFSDIVKKEFYEFKDRSDRSLVLRPEGTAGVIRAVVEEKLINKMVLPIKFFYYGPMFRYERPQSGRLRQFNQFGVECIGAENIYDDAELIIFADTCLKTIGLKNYELKINWIGDFASRKEWVNELKNYFSKYKKDLSEDSLSRLESNPLRILDDKVDGQKDFVKNAPTIDKFLSPDEREQFAILKNTLEKINVNFTVDRSLVRGLDYYTNLVFEFVSKEKVLSGQPTILGGGRYNSLVEELDGPKTSCLGFALGLERMIIALEAEGVVLEKNESPVVAIAPLNARSKLSAMGIQHILRGNGIGTVTNFSAEKLTKHFSFAEKNNVQFVIIIGDEELKKEIVQIKNQKTMKQEEVQISKIVEYIKGEMK